MKLLFFILIVILTASCGFDSSNMKSNSFEVATTLKSDTFSSNKKKTEEEIYKYGLKTISDSIKLHIYRLYYDKKIEKDSMEGYFAHFDLAPLHFDSLPNSEFMIEYVLLNKDTNYTVVSTYTLIKKNETFLRKHLRVAGVYPVSRDELKDPEFAPFIEANNPHINNWLVHELYHNKN